jgi:5-methylcytosine-specific restriction protein B
MSLKKLNTKSREFSLSQESIDKMENGRLSFISKFPLNKINELSIDEFVQGTDKNSFCYWLEFNNILFGIGGGTASKFGLYKAKDGNYYSSKGKNKSNLLDMNWTTFSQV